MNRKKVTFGKINTGKTEFLIKFIVAKHLYDKPIIPLFLQVLWSIDARIEYILSLFFLKKKWAAHLHYGTLRILCMGLQQKIDGWMSIRIDG